MYIKSTLLQMCRLYSPSLKELFFFFFTILYSVTSEM